MAKQVELQEPQKDPFLESSLTFFIQQFSYCIDYMKQYSKEEPIQKPSAMMETKAQLPDPFLNGKITEDQVMTDMFANMDHLISEFSSSVHQGKYRIFIMIENTMNWTELSPSKAADTVTEDSNKWKSEAESLKTYVSKMSEELRALTLVNFYSCSSIPGKGRNH